MFENTNPNDELIAVTMPWYGKGLVEHEIFQWCVDNCKGHVSVQNIEPIDPQPYFYGKILQKIWVFDNHQDALLFKLRWI